MVFTTELLFEVAIGSWPEWDLNPGPLNSVLDIIYKRKIKNTFFPTFRYLYEIFSSVYE